MNSQSQLDMFVVHYCGYNKNLHFFKQKLTSLGKFLENLL